MAWARLDDDGVVLEVTEDNPSGRFHPSVHWYVVPTGTFSGDHVSGSTVTRAEAPPHPPAGLRYIPLSLLRERVTAAGRWGVVAQALDSLPPEKKWLLLTLTAGISTEDREVRGLLSQTGCDPDAILSDDGP